MKKSNIMKLVEKNYGGRDIEDILKDLYVYRKMTIDQMVDELGVSKGTVHGWLKQFDIRTRSITFM